MPPLLQCALHASPPASQLAGDMPAMHLYLYPGTLTTAVACISMPAWHAGDNEFGQLGAGSSATGTSATYSITPLFVDFKYQFAMISAGGFTSVGVRRNEA